MIDFFRRLWRSTSGKITLVFAAIVFLVAIVGSVYAIVVRPGDTGFLELPGVDGDVELRWSRSDVPVSCAYLHDVPLSYLESYDRVRLALRSRVSGELLGPCVLWLLSERPDRAPDGSILLTLRVSTGSNHGAETRHRYDKRDGRILSATVDLDRDLPEDLVDRVVLHEIGHVLGLAHDRETTSVMHPIARGRSRDLSKRDAKALASAYLR